MNRDDPFASVACLAADRQQLLLPRRHPDVAGRGQALGAMPIATAVVRDGGLRTLITAIWIPAECRRSRLGWPGGRA